MAEMDNKVITCTNYGLECNSDDTKNDLEICLDCQLNLGVLRANEKRCIKVEK